jgi:hypothetical protein
MLAFNSTREETVCFLDVPKLFSGVEFIASRKHEIESVRRECPLYVLLFFELILFDWLLRRAGHSFKAGEGRSFEHFPKRPMPFEYRRALCFNFPFPISLSSFTPWCEIKSVSFGDGSDGLARTREMADAAKGNEPKIGAEVRRRGGGPGAVPSSFGRIQTRNSA